MSEPPFSLEIVKRAKTPTYRTLLQKKEARKRNLQFHILPSVTLNPTLRLVKMDSSYVGLIDIHDEYCKSRGFGREEPVLLWQEKLRTYFEAKSLDATSKEEELPPKEYQHIRLEVKNEIEAKYIPNNVLSNVSFMSKFLHFRHSAITNVYPSQYMKQTMKDSYSLWTMRKQFTLQTATTGFLIHCMFLNTRPVKIFISRETGYIGLGECTISACVVFPPRMP